MSSSGLHMLEIVALLNGVPVMGKDQDMKPFSVSIDGLLYRRPGLNKIKFTADYGMYKRRGTIIYDTVNRKFLSHRSDIELLAAMCIALSTPNKISR